MTPPQSNQERPIAALLAPDILALLDELPATVAMETEDMHPADLADVAGYHSFLVLTDETSGAYRALSLWATKMEAASAIARVEAWVRHHLARHGFRLLQPPAVLAVVDPPPSAGRGSIQAAAPAT